MKKRRPVSGPQNWTAEPGGGRKAERKAPRSEIVGKSYGKNSCEKMLIIGENMGKTWGKHGKNMGKHGKTWGKHGKNMGTSLAKISNIFRIRIGHRGKIS